MFSTEVFIKGLETQISSIWVIGKYIGIAFSWCILQYWYQRSIASIQMDIVERFTEWEIFVLFNLKNI